MATRIASAASGSPCTTQVWRGGALMWRIQAMSSLRSACAEKPASWLTSARTGTHSPKILISRSPASSRAPLLPPTWKPASTMALRASGARDFRC